MADAKAIAAGLTKAERRLLVGDFDRPFTARSYGQLRGALVRKGIFQPTVGLTRLGLEVRAILETRDD